MSMAIETSRLTKFFDNKMLKAKKTSLSSGPFDDVTFFCAVQRIPISQ